MKTILVAISGTHSDDAVLDAAYAIAKPHGAHLDFVHIPLDAIDPSEYNHHIEFARGGGLGVALRETLHNADEAVTNARAQITSYCSEKKILRVSCPAAMDRVTASWTSSLISSGIDGMVRAARTHDLTVIGRSANQRGWSKTLLEALATETGRPLLIVPHGCEEMNLDTVTVWWKDSSAAARVMTAALPLLKLAGKVYLLSVPEDADPASDPLSELSDQLAWHGISVTAEVLDRGHRPTVRVLWSASLSRQADLVVMGGFSRSRIREIMFGGCTQSVLDGGVRPVFMLH